MVKRCPWKETVKDGLAFYYNSKTKVGTYSVPYELQETKDLIEAERRSKDTSNNVVKATASTSSIPAAVSTALARLPTATTVQATVPTVLQAQAAGSRKGKGRGKRSASSTPNLLNQVLSSVNRTPVAKRPRVALSEAFSNELTPGTKDPIDSEHVLMRFREKYPNVPLAELEDKALTTTLERNRNIVAIEKELAALNTRFQDPVGGVVSLKTFVDSPPEGDTDHELYTKVKAVFCHLHNKSRVQNIRGPPENALESITIIKNDVIENRYNMKMGEFELRGVLGVDEKVEELLLFHGTNHDVVKNIIKTNFREEFLKRAAWGKGFYLTEYPANALGYGPSLLVCKVLIGRCKEICFDQHKAASNIPKEFDSKKLNQEGNGPLDGWMYVIKDPDQIQPVALIKLR